MIWYPVTFTDADGQVGTVHDYQNAIPGKACYRTACGLRLSTDHGVVSAMTDKPWCPDCERLTESGDQS